MPEYLAPGVYVEETSFRAKSIEGVSTSTTAFVGPTRKGPLGETPELLTSFGDFERIYGGLDNLALAKPINYLAQAVRSYFDNGGSRLYVARVFQAVSASDTGIAMSANVVAGTGAAEQAQFVARFPGEVGNGRITVRQTSSLATTASMERALEGTMVRFGGGGDVATPARIEGGIAPFSLPTDGVLLLTVNGTDAQITVHGEPSEAIAAVALADPITLPVTLAVTIDSVVQRITIPATPDPTLAPAALVARLNRELRGGYARLSDDGRLVIGSDRRGKQAAVAVTANPALGFTANASVAGSTNPANNVNDLLSVAAAEINDLLIAANIAARASLSATQRLILTTATAGADRTLSVRTGTGSIHEALGLAAGVPATGGAGSTVGYVVKQGNNWIDASNVTRNAASLPDPEFLTLTVITEDKDGHVMVYEDMAFDRRHQRWVGNVLSETPKRRADALENLFALRIGSGVSAFELRDGLFAADTEHVVPTNGGNAGNDGVEPVLGVVTVKGSYAAALAELEKLEDVSIVAAPGHSDYADFQAIQGALIGHAEKRRSYRIAVLDTPPAQLPGGARIVRSRIDSKYAALYYPWVVISNPLARPGDDSIPREILLPPSGFVCGIYARNDIERSVAKAPANEIVRDALRFEIDINFAQQEALNPLGINCLRYLSGRGYRVWGARTASSDPEWKYVNVRRYFNYLESSIDRGTQWAVFENNGERLWANITETISEFLFNEWISGSLLGATAQEAFFVRCDRSTMTQSDLDNGRLICLVGVAVLKPAEFVIFRIGQKTADARS